MIILWFIGFALGLGISNMMYAFYRAFTGDKDQSCKLETVAILWFILAVLIYGAFK